MIAKRRICWSEPDAVCLQGGCIYCNDYTFRAISTIENYVYNKAPQLIKDFRYGLSKNFNNAKTK